MTNLPPAFQTPESRQAFCSDFPSDPLCSIAAIQDTIPTPPPVSPVLLAALIPLAIGGLSELLNRDRHITTIERNDLDQLRRYCNGIDPHLIPWRPVGHKRPAWLPWLRRLVGLKSAAAGRHEGTAAYGASGFEVKPISSFVPHGNGVAEAAAAKESSALGFTAGDIAVIKRMAREGESLRSICSHLGIKPGGNSRRYKVVQKYHKQGKAER